MINKLKRFFKKEKGQGLVEYGLILALISVLSIGAVTSVGGSVKETFNGIDQAMVIPPPVNDEAFTWTLDAAGYRSTNPEHTGNGFYKYTGSDLAVDIPHTIHGHKMTSYYKMFEYTYVRKVSHNNPKITNMVYMFNRSKAPTLDVSGLDTNNVLNMHGMFERAEARTLDLSTFNTEKVTDMSVMFYGTQAKSIDLSSFNTRKLEHTGHMFWQNEAEVLDLSSFDTRNFKITDAMFEGALAKQGFAKNQSDADRLNLTSDLPSELKFIVKP